LDLIDQDQHNTLQKQDNLKDYKIISMPNNNIKEAIQSIVSPLKQ